MVTCFSFKSCFGPRASNKTVPVNHPEISTSSFVVGSSKEIYPVAEAVETSGSGGESLRPQSQQVISNNKIHDVLNNNKGIDKSSRNNPSILLQSAPPPPLHPQRGKSTVGSNKAKNDGPSIVSDQLNPIVGALIMTVTLIVMLIWGKICAIICTAAVFYIIIPRFRANDDMCNINKSRNCSKCADVDADSWEFKRKVVLQGFLERF